MAAPVGTVSFACGADRWSPWTGKPASPLRRVGIETGKLCFDPEEAEAADLELAVGTALISDAGDSAWDIVSLAEELITVGVTTGASAVEDDRAVAEGSGPLPSTAIQTIEQSSSSSFWAMGAVNATAKNKMNNNEVFIFTEYD
jgi:hypothetical protein